MYVHGMNIAVRVTPEDAARYRARAMEAGTTLAALARAAWTAPPRPLTPREHVAALEAWAATLDRYSPSRGPLGAALATLARLVRDA